MVHCLKVNVLTYCVFVTPMVLSKSIARWLSNDEAFIHTHTHTMVDIESRRHGHISVFCIPSIQWNPGLLYVIDMFFRLKLCPRMINWIYICIHKEFKIPYLVLYLPRIIWQMYDLFKYLLLQYYQWATRITIFVIPVNTTSQKRNETNYTWWNIYTI